MKTLYMRLQEARNHLGVPWEILERDYILSWILAAINQVDVLKDKLVFKGGTALEKCYFGDYRFSEDIDFSANTGTGRGDELEKAMQQACRYTADMLEDYAPVDVVSERYVESQPHPEGQEAFIIRARFPWQRNLQTRVMVEVTMQEKIIKPIQYRNVIHNYEEPLISKIPVYALEEIIAEKLRAILQHAEKLKERGWSRSRARDYYDLWRILNAYKNELDFSQFGTFLHEKCTAKNITFSTVEDFFEKDMLAYVQKTWKQWLAPLVPDLPSSEKIIEELRPQIQALIDQ